jgi:hypothetical protein
MPVEIHGQSYATVAERLKLARGEDFTPPTGIKSIETDTVQCGNLTVIHARITFANGGVFDGSSLVNLQATGPAERDAPLETAETSAVGRALAMAGYPGSEQGLAGAEEIALAQRRGEARSVTRFADGSSPVTRMSGGGSGAAPRPAGGGPSPAQSRYLNQLWEQAGRPFPPPEPATGREASNIIDELRTELGIPPRDR